MKVRKSYSSYLATTLAYRESQPIEAVRLDSLVTRLRSGDKSVIEEIIIGHYRLVAGLVGELCRAVRRLDDTMGAALLALTEAVHHAETALYDNNITSYITTSVRYAIKDHYGNDHLCRIPPRTVRWKLARGQEFSKIVPGDGMQIDEGAGEHGDDSDAEQRLSLNNSEFRLPYIIPIAPSPAITESLEFKEAVLRTATTPEELIILNLRLEGFGYAEISKKVSLSTPRIGQIVPPLIERLSILVR